MCLIAKRMLDILVSASLLLLLSPLLLWISWRVYRELGSPILFRQERTGRHQRSFTLIKFRSMHTGHSDDAERLSDFGQWLRASSLDELPELWNILRGDMSLVGPRPLLPDYLPYYTASEATRHNMRPGLTGLAQVSGRNALSWEDRLRLDAEYVARWSLRLDIIILVKTFMAVIRRDGISAEGHATMPRLDESRKQAPHAS